MTDIQAALGLHQLRKLPKFHAKRRAIVLRYQAAFRSFDQLEIPIKRDGVQHAWHLYVLRLNLDRSQMTRNQFIEEMGDRKIGCSVHFIPIHLHQYYREKYGYKPEDFPIALREYERMVSLPLSPRMTEEDVSDVISAVTNIIRERKPAVTVQTADVATV
jgi:dTDP-4-amino-4,6-dideoxygalactose transaminase